MEEDVSSAATEAADVDVSCSSDSDSDEEEKASYAKCTSILLSMF